ncbi:MAG TPA: primosomal protein N' [Pseudomonadales bacterium]
MTNPLERIVRVAVPVPLHRQFDYAVPDDMPTPVPGARVVVPFAGRRLVGLAMELNPQDAHERLKPVAAVLDDHNVLGEEIFQLGRWLAAYYQHPLGEVMATLLPSAARRPEPLRQRRPEVWELAAPAPSFRRAPRQQALFRLISERGGALAMDDIRAAGFERTHVKSLASKGLLRRRQAPMVAPAPPAVQDPAALPVLNAEQAAVLNELEESRGFAPFLLDGITGSGKTEVYLRAIEDVLRRGRQVLVLVPEIALTPQTLARFEARFGQAAVMHSNMADRARLQVWLQARGKEAGILIGTRSAVLTPFADLGLIVVDEEHDASFKQTDGLRYSARDVAVKRARDLDIPLILGSATPSFESLHNAHTGRYRHLRLTERAGGASLPEYRLLDIRGQVLDGGLSQELLLAIGRHLQAGSQSLVFLNRRGFAPSLACSQCQWQARCPACEWAMTMHQRPPALICHHCGRRDRLAEACPACGRQTLIAVGAGTQRCESVLAERFPGVPVHRIDRDTTRSQRRLEAQLENIGNGQPAILVGTQMLAKGHHFPHVTLVAVVNADGGFMSPDFRAPERTAQLIVQVAGRAGRAERPGVVYVQTYQPENPLLTTLIQDGYGAFAARELEVRAAAELPPHRPMALIRAEAADAAAAQSWLVRLAAQIGADADVFGPAPALMPRVADRLRYQLMLTAPDRTRLHRALAPLKTAEDVPRGVRWSVDVDPYDTF